MAVSVIQFSKHSMRTLFSQSTNLHAIFVSCQFKEGEKNIWGGVES
jgi:hypothetical protein